MSAISTTQAFASSQIHLNEKDGQTHGKRLPDRKENRAGRNVRSLFRNCQKQHHRQLFRKHRRFVRAHVPLRQIPITLGTESQVHGSQSRRFWHYRCLDICLNGRSVTTRSRRGFFSERKSLHDHPRNAKDASRRTVAATLVDAVRDISQATQNYDSAQSQH